MAIQCLRKLSCWIAASQAPRDDELGAQTFDLDLDVAAGVLFVFHGQARQHRNAPSTTGLPRSARNDGAGPGLPRSARDDFSSKVTCQAGLAKTSIFQTVDALVFTKKAQSESHCAQTRPSQSYLNHQAYRSTRNRRLHGTHDGPANRPSRDGPTTRGVAAHCSQPEATWPLSAHSCRTDRNEKGVANPSEILWCSPKPEAGLPSYLRLASSRSFNNASAVAKRARRL